MKTRGNLWNVAAGNKEEYFQCYLLNWVQCYHYNDSAKYHLQIHLISNSKFWWLRVLPWRARGGTTVDHRIRHQRRAYSEISIRIDKWFCKILISDSTHFKLKVLIAECVILESQENICWISQEGTKKSMFRVIFQIGFDIMTPSILQNIILWLNLFWIESSDNRVCYCDQSVSQQRTERSIFRAIFNVITAIILQNAVLRLNIF